MANIRLDVNVETKGAEKIKTLGSDFSTTSTSAGAFADSVGRVSTTLARSADTFGLPTQALRALDDAMDVAELGFNNLSTAAAGFNAASVGVAGAGFAIGTAIGGLIRDIPGVAAEVDKLVLSLANLAGMETSPRGWAPGELERIQAAYKNVQATVVESAGGFDKWVQGAINAKDNAKALADASKIVGQHITDIDKAKAILKVAEDTKKAGEEQKRLGDAAAATQKRFQDQQKQIALGYVELRKEAESFFTTLEKRAEVDLGEQIFGSQAVSNIDSALSSVNAMGVAFGSAKVSADDVARAAEGINRASIEGAAAQNQARVATDATRLAIEQSKGASIDWKGELQDLANLAQTLPSIFGQSFGSILGGIAGIGNSISKLKDLGGGSMGGIMSALTGGKGLGAFLGSLGQIGAAIGAAVGIAKGIGSALGIGGNQVIMQLNDVRDAWFETRGGFVAVQQSLVGLTDQDLVKAIFDADTVEQFNAAVGAVEQTIAGATQTQAEANAVTAEGQQVVQAAEAAGSSFAQTMTEGFASVVTAISTVATQIQALISQLTAIPNIERTVTVHTNYEGGGLPGGGGDGGLPGGGEEQLIVGGNRIFKREFQRGIDQVPRGPLAGGGLPAILHPGEAVLNKSRAQDYRAGASGTTVTASIAPVFNMAGGMDDKFKRQVLAELERSVRLGIGNVTHEIKRKARRAA
jgi:hypothetical protein